MRVGCVDGRGTQRWKIGIFMYGAYEMIEPVNWESTMELRKPNSVEVTPNSGHGERLHIQPSVHYKDH